MHRHRKEEDDPGEIQEEEGPDPSEKGALFPQKIGPYNQKDRQGNASHEEEQGEGRTETVEGVREGTPGTAEREEDPDRDRIGFEHAQLHGAGRYRPLDRVKGVVSLWRKRNQRL